MTEQNHLTEKQLFVNVQLSIIMNLIHALTVGFITECKVRNAVFLIGGMT